MHPGPPAITLHQPIEARPGDLETVNRRRAWIPLGTTHQRRGTPFPRRRADLQYLAHPGCPCQLSEERVASRSSVISGGMTRSSSEPSRLPQSEPKAAEEAHGIYAVQCQPSTRPGVEASRLGTGRVDHPTVKGERRLDNSVLTEGAHHTGTRRLAEPRALRSILEKPLQRGPELGSRTFLDHDPSIADH